MKACVEVKEVPLTVQLLIPKGEEKKKRLDSFPSTQEEGEEEEKAVDSSFNLILFINPAFLRNDRREGEEEKENSEELGNQLFGGIDDLFIIITITQRQSAAKID